MRATDPGPSYTDERYLGLVIADRDDPALHEAIALGGGRLLRRIGWDSLDALDEQARRPILIVEAGGVPDAVLGAALDRIVATASALHWPLVVTFAPEQIDLVVACIGTTPAELLCAPSPADRIAALAIARGRLVDRLSDSRVRENEAERLRQLNEEVARIAAVLIELTHREGAMQHGAKDVADRRSGYDAGPVGDVRIDPAEIRRTLRERRLRDEIFGPGLFEDPAWDMLLDLFAAELEHRDVSVSSLCIAAAVAPTTALRWIARMTEAGLLERRPDPLDRRRVFMGLTASSRDGMRRYFAELQRPRRTRR